MSGLMAGKRGLIMGLANDRSLAWGIARQLADQGAELAFSYQGEALEKRVRPLAAELGSDFLIDCDVSDKGPLDDAFARLAQRWDGLDFVVHAIGFSDKNELRGKFVDTSLDNFLLTMNISVFSFIAVAQRARAMMKPGGSLLTLTYYGAEKVIPHYNVMGVAKAALETSVKYLAADLGPEGIRVNAIQPGIVEGPRIQRVFENKARARGVSYEKIREDALSVVSMRTTVTPQQIADTIVFICSEKGRTISGQAISVCGDTQMLP